MRTFRIGNPINGELEGLSTRNQPILRSILPSHQSLPPLLFVFLGSFKVGVAVPTTSKHVTIQAQSFGIPLLLSPTPSLSEGVLLSICTSAMEAFWESFIFLPPGCPLVYRHDFKAMADRRVDFHRVTCHDLLPFFGMDLHHGLGVHGSLDFSPQIGSDVLQAHFL